MNSQRSLRDALRSGEVLLHCGATGTELIKRGGPAPGGLANLQCPQMVAEIELSYLEVGADLFLTNSFSMNRCYVENHIPGCDYREINRIGAEISTSSIGDHGFVLGCIGPIGTLLKPYGKADPQDAEDAFAEQVQILEDGGVDGYSVQTFYDLNELELAVRAVRSVSQRPILASLCLETSGRTMMGDSLDAAYERLIPYHIDVLGHNCGDLDSFQLADIFENCSCRGKIPLFSLVNAGRPLMDNGRMYYNLTPCEFARGARRLYEVGVRVIGGCCGTTPEHIAAARDELAALENSAQ